MTKPADAPGMGMSQSTLLELGEEQTDAMVNMQKELLLAYTQTSRSWLARVKSEVDLSSQLAEKLGKDPTPAGGVGRLSAMCPVTRVDGSRGWAAAARGLSGPFAEDRATIVRWLTDGGHRESAMMQNPEGPIAAIIGAMHGRWRTSIETRRARKVQLAERGSPHEWEKLIRKLRWIGLEDEARRLELAVSTVPPDVRDRSVEHRLGSKFRKRFFEADQPCPYDMGSDNRDPGCESEAARRQERTHRRHR
jgi:hypothetical protein